MKVVIFDRMEECTEEEVQRMLPLVSAQRREQALRYKHTFGQFCCLKAWLLLEEEIRGLEGERIRGLEIRGSRVESIWQYNEHGKPYIEGGPYFSISHCKEGIAVAIDDKPIGIDIEAIRHAEEDLIERTMNAEEVERIRGLEIRGLEDREFTRLWTQKEAIVKAQGVGIVSFEQLQTILDESKKSRVKSRELKVESVEKEKYIYSVAVVNR